MTVDPIVAEIKSDMVRAHRVDGECRYIFKGSPEGLIRLAEAMRRTGVKEIQAIVVQGDV